MSSFLCIEFDSITMEIADNKKFPIVWIEKSEIKVSYTITERTYSMFCKCDNINIQIKDAKTRNEYIPERIVR